MSKTKGTNIGANLSIQLDNVKGALDLAHEAVINNSDGSPELQAASGAIDLARQEIDRISERLCDAKRVTLVPRLEVVHD